MKKLIYISFILLIMIVYSCTPQKRLNRLVKKHPELIRIDTFLDIDTFITTETFLDTFTVFNKEVDTFIYETEKVRLELIKKHDTVYIEYWDKPDTIIQTETIPYPVIENIEVTPWWVYLVIAGCAILVILFLIKILK